MFYIMDIKQSVIDFWNNRPCNIKHSDKQIGTKEYFEEVSNRKFFVESHILDFVHFKNYNNKKVLEVGCGIGTTAHKFIEHGADYTGIDISEESINVAKERFKLFNLNGTLSVNDIEQCVLNDQFDLVYSFGVLHHTPDINKAIENIHRMLKPGGEFKLMLYASNSWKKFCIDSGLDQFEAQNGCPVAYTFSHEEVIKLLKNFVNIDIKQDHIFQYNIESYKNYEYKKEPWFENMPPELIETLEKNIGWHLLITCFKE